MSDEMPLPRPYISPSQLNRHSFCGQQYEYVYGQGLRMPPGIAIIKGRMPHAAAEVNYRQKIETGVDLPAKQLAEVAASEFERAVMQDGVTLTDAEAKVGKENVLGLAKDRGVGLTYLFHATVAPTIQPSLVEETIRIDLPNSSHDLLGRLDVATTDHVVADLKTSARKKPQAEVDSSLQLSWYAAAYRWKTGHEAKAVQLDVLVDSKIQQSQRLVGYRTQRDTEVLVSRVNAMLAALRAGVIMPAKLGDPLCSPKFCGFWRICPWVNSERKAAGDADE